MRLEDLHARLLRHKHKEVETMVKLGILASSVKNSEQESSLGTLLLQSSSTIQPDFGSTSAVQQSYKNEEQGTYTYRRRYVAVLDTNNTFHVINRIAPKGFEGIDPEIRTFPQVNIYDRLHRGSMRDSKKEKAIYYSSGAAMTHSAFI